VTGTGGGWQPGSGGAWHPGSGGGPGAHRPARQLRSANLHNLPAVAVLCCAAGGLAYAVVIQEHWLRGVLFMAGALILAALLRLALPARQAGLLAVRGRMADVLCYAGTGAALWVVGLLLPPTRT